MKDNKSKEERGINTNCDGEADTTDIKSTIEITPETPVELPKSLGKNTWLYPTDDFGKMEEGRTL